MLAAFQGNATSEQSAVLQAWLDADTDNRYLFEQLSRVWASTKFSEKAHFDVEHAWKEVLDRIMIMMKFRRRRYEYHPYRRFFRTVKPALKIAAVFLIAFLSGIAVTFMGNDPESVTYIEMNAPKGSRAFMTLDDGTKVWLNAESKLRYPKTYGVKQRNVMLSGEAYFEVAKNGKIPFIVNANGINITALGTSFNVKAYDDDGTVETTLTEGAVQIASDNNATLQPIVLQPNQRVLLTAGGSVVQQSAEVELYAAENSAPHQASDGAKKVKVVHLTDTRPYTSWKDERWVFKHQNLSELSVKLGRRYNVAFVFEDEQLKDYTISGTLLDETLEQVLNTLRLTVPIKYSIDHKTVILSEDTKLKKQYRQLLVN
jgi:ferric-dicitrate binding protein FerR (iron transport regulator)